jgi:hypothetical protein
LEILWTVRDSEGEQIATLAQANAVEAGSLNGDWGGLARTIADAAAPDVVELWRRMPGG